MQRTQIYRKGRRNSILNFLSPYLCGMLIVLEYFPSDREVCSKRKKLKQKPPKLLLSSYNGMIFAIKKEIWQVIRKLDAPHIEMKVISSEFI
ncbi:hypothetical protein CEXT_427971 [Caerostris extrusa]|uniref:Uncharacterized protein n=1 Tax=Caerostris extrusa TaxID=172846 RepID=A0AAV4Y1X2_CAEEX|nr:hypothetical protein CEXT_427971 [Caerostris extrusa]